MELKNKTIIVTGGASGLGEATARQLTKAGANVIIADLNEENGKKLEAELKQARFFSTNIADETSATACVDFAVNTFGNIDGLVNCAGIATAEKILDKEGNIHKLKTFSKTIEVNLIGSFNMIRLVAAAMAKKQNNDTAVSRGVIINTASVAAFDGQIGQVAYSASKGGIVSMTLPLARELGAHRIRVMTIAPGIFETPMLAALPEKAKESLGQQVPYPNRLGKPSEFASLCQHIFENEMLNGEVIRLDGAMRMAAR